MTDDLPTAIVSADLRPSKLKILKQSGRLATTVGACSGRRWRRAHTPVGRVTHAADLLPCRPVPAGSQSTVGTAAPSAGPAGSHRTVGTRVGDRQSPEYREHGRVQHSARELAFGTCVWSGGSAAQL